jgi:hypothetical protein
MHTNIFEPFSTFLVFIVIALIMQACCEVGYRIGQHVRTRQDKEAPISLGPMVGGLLGMLAFVLAFLFSMAADQYNVRKQNVLDEADAIGTAYLRTDLLPSHQAELKTWLREYVDVRLDAVTNARNLESAIARSIEIHALLWSRVSSAAIAQPDTNTALMVQSINDLIDMHEKRITAGLHSRIPDSIWLALIIICILTMTTMGIQMGFSGKRRLVAMIPLSLAFAVLVTLVVDLDRPQKGLITIGQQSMMDLQQEMRHGDEKATPDHTEPAAH